MRTHYYLHNLNKNTYLYLGTGKWDTIFSVADGIILINKYSYPTLTNALRTKVYYGNVMISKTVCLEIAEFLFAWTEGNSVLLHASSAEHKLRADAEIPAPACMFK